MTTNRVLYALLAVLVAVLVGIALLLRQGSGIDRRTTDQSALVRQLQMAEQQRQCQARVQAQGFALILDLLADNFATPPAPDPERLRAVQGLREAADVFRGPSKECTP